jgi:plastocyanin
MYRQVIGMKAKALVLLFVLSAVMLSGCTGDKTTDGGVNVTDNITTGTDGDDNITPENTSDVSLGETEHDTTTEEQPTVDVPVKETTTQGPQVIDTGVPRSYTIRLEKFLSSPNTLVVAPKDTVFWINFNDPIRAFTIVSEDGLWESRSIGYRQSFSYTFNETGTYNYSILGNPRMSGTIIVK